MIPPVIAGFAARIGLKGALIIACAAAALLLAWRLQWLGAERERLEAALAVSEQRVEQAEGGLAEAKAINARMTAALQAQNQAIAAAQEALSREQKAAQGRLKAAIAQNEVARKAELVLFGNPMAPSPETLNAALREIVESM